MHTTELKFENGILLPSDSKKIYELLSEISCITYIIAYMHASCGEEVSTYKLEGNNEI